MIQEEDQISIVNALRYLGEVFQSLRCSFGSEERSGSSHSQSKDKEEKVKVLFPPEEVFDRDDFAELLATAKTGISLTDHYNGTCKYGEVLDHDFSIKGHPNIHVVDASAFPSIIDGNTKYGTLTIAELAASRIECQ